MSKPLKSENQDPKQRQKARIEPILDRKFDYGDDQHYRDSVRRFGRHCPCCRISPLYIHQVRQASPSIDPRRNRIMYDYVLFFGCFFVFFFLFFLFFFLNNIVFCWFFFLLESQFLVKKNILNL